MKLAAWCTEKGLHEQALAHYSVVTRLDPSRDSAWKHLGYKKQGNRWVKPDEVAAAKQEALQQKQADKHWKTTLEKLREGLVNKDAQKRSKAEAGLREVTDPRAVPMVWALFVRGGERLQIAAVQMLGQIDGPSASNGLAVLAVFSPAAEVRTRAIDDIEPARSARCRRAVDRPDSQAIQVSGASCERAGIARGTVRRGRAVQHPAVLSEPANNACAQSRPTVHARYAV